MTVEISLTLRNMKTPVYFLSLWDPVRLGIINKFSYTRLLESLSDLEEKDKIYVKLRK